VCYLVNVLRWWTNITGQSTSLWSHCHHYCFYFTILCFENCLYNSDIFYISIIYFWKFWVKYFQSVKQVQRFTTKIENVFSIIINLYKFYWDFWPKMTLKSALHTNFYIFRTQCLYIYKDFYPCSSVSNLNSVVRQSKLLLLYLMT